MGILNTVAGYSSGYDPYATNPKVSEGDELGRETFLNLLMVQLQNQNPLDPMDDTEFTAQLAQFSSLESLENINSGIESLNDGALRQDMLGAVDFIGKEVLAYGYELSKDGDTVSSVSYELEEDASQMFINVYDADNNIIYTENVGARQQGTYTFNWDGKDFNGRDQTDGVYSVAISAEDSEGDSMLANLEVSGTVASVFNQNGTPYLRLKDGREISYYNVTEVVGKNNVTSSNTSETTENNENDEGGGA